MKENVKTDEKGFRTRKGNVLGIISLALSGVSLIGSWIPILNVISMILAAAGIVLGIISIVMMCLKKVGLLVLPILGIVLGVATFILGVFVNNSLVEQSKKLSDAVSQSTNTASTQDGSKNDNSSSSNNATLQGKASQDNSKTESTTQNKVFNVSDIISWDGKQIIVTDTVRNYKAKYSKPKSGKEFIKVTISVVNKSDKDMLVSPMKFKVQDSTGAKETLESCTYSLSDPFETATLSPGGSRQGSIVFEVTKNDTDLKLICTANSALPADALEIKL